MNSNEREDYNILMKRLCIGLGALPSPERMDTFFAGLAKMSLIQFSRVVDACLDEDSACNGKLPTIPGVWKIWRGIRDKARATTRRLEPPPPKQSRQLMQVNGLFLKYLYRRRVVEKTPATVNIDIEGRRRVCLDLVKFLEASAAEDLSPTDSEVRAMFDKAMEKVSDYEPETT